MLKQTKEFPHLVSLDQVNQFIASKASEQIVVVESAKNQIEPENVSSGRIFLPLVGFFLNSNYSLNTDLRAIESWLSSAGISNESTILVYSQNMALSCFIYWFFRNLGHKSVAVINSGELPLPVLNLQTVGEAVYKIPDFDYQNWISTEEVKLAINDRSNRILDVRTREEFSGVWFTDGPPLDGQRTGRIPNSEHIPHDLFLNSAGQIDEIKVLKIIGEYGLSEKSNYICYCAAGFRSALTWFILKELVGFPNVRNYSGSWLEWSADSSTPVVL